ncbi:MAG TPA: DNA-processing protein DprA [Candidatus Saccharimonadales bacterium]|nr:DNA-processing protein DprA [Candidatus Saccharimonadales bacterium]
MDVKKLTVDDSAYPSPLRELADAPDTLFYRGADPAGWIGQPRVAIVGSRAVSAYGKSVTAKLARELAERGVVIISGLALGVDGIAHEACLEAGGTTVAVLANGLDRIYPATHTRLAQRILDQGGTIMSEYAAGMPGFKWNFIARNRIVASLAQALLITEAAEKSGTLHTAKFALEQGREVLAVPGNITSPGSAGANNLIKSGAAPVTSVEDIVYALGLTTAHAQEQPRAKGSNPEEQSLLDLLAKGISDGHDLLIRSQLAASAFSQALTMLEISGKVRALGNNHWALR